jgi:dihydroceramide fatty acyl 2-hydroxylase
MPAVAAERERAAPEAAGARRGGAAAAAPPPPRLQIDERRPLLAQVPALGADYAAWLAAPSPGRPRFFESRLLEACSTSSPLGPPAVWLPAALWALAAATRGAGGLPPAAAAAAFAAGVHLWQVAEYTIHRFVFHHAPTSSIGILVHFALHGCHHKFPRDFGRMVFPPLPAAPLAAAALALLRLALPARVAAAAFAGLMAGYLAYDLGHYAMHARGAGGALRRRHMDHHFRDATTNFGISSPLFDRLLGTAAGAAKTEA